MSSFLKANFLAKEQDKKKAKLLLLRALETPAHTHW